MKNIAVFGGMNMDVLGVPQGAFALRDSIVGTVRMTAGGVGRNIAEHLAGRADTAVYLVTAVGSDAFAGALRQDCAAKNIRLQHSLSAEGPSPVYLAVHDAGRDMVAAINDMALMDKLTPEQVLGILPDLPPLRCAVLDANLRADTLLAIARHASFPLIADPVSAEKSQRLIPLLPYLDAIKPNLLEAEAMTGEKDPEKASLRLVEQGVRRVFISLGEKGLHYRDGASCGLLPARTIAHGYLTGAGDALCAGLCYALCSGVDTAQIAQTGQDFAIDYLLSNRKGDNV